MCLDRKGKVMKPLQRVKRIATNTRKWAESYQARHQLDFTPNLCGMCSLASYELFKRLKRANLDPKYCLTPHHAFIKCQGHIVDVTATQFYNEHQPVTVVKPRGQNKFYWNKPTYHKTRKEIIKALAADWPEFQVHPEIREAVLSEKQ
jgi:hypothetical protein